MKTTKVEMAKAIYEYIKEELTETVWREVAWKFTFAMDSSFEKGRNLVDAYLNQDFERIAKRLKVTELEAILKVFSEEIVEEKQESPSKELKVDFLHSNGESEEVTFAGDNCVEEFNLYCEKDGIEEYVILSGEELILNKAAKMGRTYDNGEPVRVGDYVTINQGKYKGNRAEVIEVGGCVYVSTQIRPNHSARVEIEIHESWLTVNEFTFYVGGNIGGQRVFYKVKDYNQARYVAENIEYTHGHVTINEKKPKEGQTVFTIDNKPHFYKFNGYGNRG